jgi:hypothetical protein
MKKNEQQNFGPDLQDWDEKMDDEKEVKITLDKLDSNVDGQPMETRYSRRKK